MKNLLKICLILFVTMIVVAIFASGKSKKTVETETVETETRNMIWEFMIERDYDVNTVLGVPEIYKTELEDGWHVKTTDGKEYAVVVYEGSVCAITPIN